MLRRAEIARRRYVLDLGCGSGAVTGELVRRCGGRVVAMDCHRPALANQAALPTGARLVCGDAGKLPFGPATFDLVFAQFTLLWLDAAAALDEIRRVLQPGGVLAAIEPDYGGMIEHPPEIATRDLWLAGLSRAGADPLLGRKLPGLLAAAGFRARIDLLDHLAAPSPARFDLLGELPLSESERTHLAEIASADARLDDPAKVAHLPMLLVTAVR